ncbi:ABC transporter permease [Allosphingosinicella indica]|uniref:Putative ABC transport system permease protein n=1 Tax=Allosphingosinicella indica TaxID=941907 RepID=A0A1X7G8W8_9SPHN|nr:ABC transporter permease [Allosphingosinicella indica]SMF66001.1 putative ABC transport system permease protein [Allosphingosinicella indica]
MWRNYLTTGVRALVKHKTYSFITIFGMAIGMAACLMILLFVRYETSYDKWVPGAENIYQFQTWFRDPDTGEEGQVQMAPYVTKGLLQKDFPQIENATYALFSAPVVFMNGQAASTKDYIYVADNFLDTVPLPMLHGDKAALDRPNVVLLSRSEAVARFGTDNVVGKTFSLISKGIRTDYPVGGVFQNLPKNSHMRINAIVRVDMGTYMANEPQFLDCWGCQGGWVYLKLKPGADPETITRQLHAWEKRNIPDQNAGEARFNAGDFSDWHVVNIRDVHLGRAQEGAMSPGNDRKTIVTFGIIALLILAMAVVNFTNLATARASQRAREVALRKVLGAARRQLIIQFIGESILIAFLAMLIALAMVEVLMPAFAAFLDADIKVRYFGADGIALPMVALVLVVGVVAGTYPAFFLSRFQPAQVLKANKSSSEAAGTGRLRTALVIGQFAVSIGLMICTAVIYAQTVYARTVDPGFKRDHIVQIDGLNRYQLINSGNQIVERFKNVEGVKAVGRTGIGIATDGNNNTGVMVPGNPKPVNIGFYNVDPGFLDAMGMRMVAGRWFDENRPLDNATLPFPPTPEAQTALAARGANIVVNESGARRLGYTNPRDIIGKQFRVAMVEDQFGLVPVTVVGVAADARFRSVKQPLDDIMFVSGDSGHQVLIVRYQGDPAAMRGRLESAWREITTEVPFDAKFSEDIIGELYRADDARAKTFAAFALLSVVVGCLGLFGLAAFTAERRTKEIGIRKVLGARSRDIVRLLAWQFSKPVIIANLIAWPVAWWVMRDWLNSFDARIALGPTPFVLAGGLALAIALGTIAGHAFRVARTNPIHALRYE